jgi:hypothetical protein
MIINRTRGSGAFPVTFLVRYGLLITFLQIGGPDDAHVGQVSQSAQWAPFGAGYKWHNTTDNMVVVDWTLSHQNTYSGGIYQQPTSVVTTTSRFIRTGVSVG